ncbi:hypothetical protein [Methylophaga sp. OBS4]|uniref:hypothetical protein n=1 Tax=Methylophaga sp. OBS4 TaxID=2991935 RepID=UPI0022517721|nr:hypothetical protein [Methylophaga sp. OBS4]MCX4187660.1 hypothetical protein [Methylophaga sp. OBS4]
MATDNNPTESLHMINVCLIGADLEHEKALLINQPNIAVTMLDDAEPEPLLLRLSEITPDIAIVSDEASPISADELCLLISLRSPQTKTLIISNDSPDFERLQASGFTCRGYITSQQRSAIVRAVRVVFDGEAWLPRKLVTELLDRLAVRAMTEQQQLKSVKKC